MTSTEYHKVFERFKPVCVKLLRDHTLDNVKELHKILQVPIDPEILQQLQEYILFPLHLIQKQSPNKCETFRTEVISCQKSLLNQTEVDRFEMFQDMFTSLCISLSSADPQNKVVPLCEELKLALVQCLSALVNSTTVSLLEQIYQASFLPPMGHAVSILLHLAETEGMRQLRQDAITCIQDLAALNRKVPTKHQVMAGDMFASFLPGISMAMTKVATGDCKQGYLVTKAAIETWAGMVSLVLGDKYLNSEYKHRLSETKDDKPYDKLVVIRSPEWVASTTEKLKILISKIAPVANNSNWRVRLAMVEWADRLLTNCSKSLELCASDLLNVLVSRVADEYEKVVSASQQALITFQKISATKNKTFVEILEDNLHVLATVLPRLIRNSDDDAKLAHLCLFNGYLRLLGPHMDSLLNSSTHLQHLSAALLQVLELDCTGLHIIQEKTPTVLSHGLEVRNSPGWLKKSFKHFTDSKIEKELVTTCHLIGYYGDLDIVLDHFLEKFMQSSLHRKQAAFILNQIIVGCTEQDLAFGIPTACNKGEDTLLHNIRMITEEYLQPEHWNLPTSNQPNDGMPTENNPDWVVVRTNHRWPKTHSLTVEQINSNILQTCLMLEGLAEFSKVLGVNFHPLLMDVLYPVLEKLGDENNTVSQTAYTALCYICDACHYSNIQDLILSNADYLVNSISLRLRHLASNPKAPLVLKVTVTYSNKDILPVIDDTITEVFESLDCHYEEKSLMFLQILHALVMSINQWFPVTTSKNCALDTNIVDNLNINMKETESKQNEHHSLQDIGAFFMEYLQQRRIVESLDSDEREMDTGDSCVENDVEMESDVKCDPPKHVVIVKQVMERCVHLLASPSPRLRLLVLDTIAQCSQALQTHEDELLPLVHKVWSPFVLRFTDEEKLVIVKAFYVLRVLADTSGDFIRQRVVKDVIPKVTDLLYKLASHSQKTGPAYRFTTACRLQLAIIDNISLLTSKIGLSDQHLAPVLEASLPYLSCKQNSVLQEAAVQLWLRFARYQPDYVWLILNNVYSPETLQPPHQCFKEIQMPGSRTRNEYSDNIEKILSIID